MNYSLIAFDLDDTLLTHDLQITPRTKVALAAAKEANLHIMVSTGRMYTSALPYIRQMGVSVPVVTYNGAMIVDSADDRVIKHFPVSLELAQEVLADAAEMGLYTQVYIDDVLYANFAGQERDYYAAQCGVDPVIVGDMREFLKSETTKVLLMSTPEHVRQIYPQMCAKYAGRLEVTVSKPRYLEFLNPLATKGNGIDTVAGMLSIPRERVIAVGDSLNDISMIQYAGLGVAVGNAADAVKAAADMVIETNEDDGAARLIERVLKGEV